jgi:hypothetical protein
MTEQGVSRDAAWIEREYGSEKWPAILDRIEAELAAGETDLARIVNKVKDWELGRGGKADRRVVVMGRPLDLPYALGFRAGANLIFEKLAEHLQGAEAIIELGSGWGYNLFHLWLTGAPRTARYFALEYTQAGRRCSERLAGLGAGPDLTTLPFDYYHVDLSALGRFSGRVAVFSLFSIDQIPTLPPDIFPALAALAPQVDCLHFEPAGWQMTDDECVGSSRAYAERHDYNRNLWPLLQQLDREGLLRIEESFPNFFGQNPKNSAALIRWSSGINA